MIEEFVNINIRGVLNTVLPCIDKFRPRKRGHVAVVGSLASFAPLVGSGMYSATKACVYHMCEDLRPHLRLFNIGCTLIAPGYVQTPLLKRINTDKSKVLDVNVAAQTIIDGMLLR